MVQASASADFADEELSPAKATGPVSPTVRVTKIDKVKSDFKSFITSSILFNPEQFGQPRCESNSESRASAPYMAESPVVIRRR